MPDHMLCQLLSSLRGHSKMPKSADSDTSNLIGLAGPMSTLTYNTSVLCVMQERHDGFLYPISAILANRTPRIITLAGLPFRN